MREIAVLLRGFYCRYCKLACIAILLSLKEIKEVKKVLTSGAGDGILLL
jgi:hypothetical protein